jgi:tungstate transport system permease protein
MNLLWDEIKAAVPLIFHGNPYLFSVIGFTLKVAVIATAVATVLGLPIGLAIGLGRFRGRRTLQIFANASLGLPPVLVGLFLFLVFVPQAPLGSLQLNTTRNAVYIAQAILAMPYTVALTAAAVQGLPPELLRQARLLGAGRVRVAALALREARVGVVAAVLAALGTALSEVAAIAIVGGNVYGYDQTLASASLYEANQARYADATAIAIVLLALIVILMGGVSLLQHSGGGIRMRFRARPAPAPA